VSSVPPSHSPAAPPTLPEERHGGPPERAEHLPGWPAWTAPVALLVGFLVTIFAAAIVTIAIGAPTSPEEAADQPGLNVGLTFVQHAALIGAALLFARMVARPWPRDFGLRATRLGPGVGWALLTVLVFLAATVILALTLGIEEEESTDNVLETLGVGDSALLFLGAVLVVCVAAPIAEEVFFRGYFFTALRTSMGIAVATVITGLIFGAIHIPNFLGDAATNELIAGVVALSVFGGALCLLYVRTGSLYPCIGAHAINNCLAFSVAEGLAVLEALALFAGTAVAITALLWPLHRLRPPATGTPVPAPA
jgi:membrane protease YdiL (CAAX protease family)